MGEAVEEPGAGESPIAFDGGEGDIESGGDFFLIEAAEEAQLDHLATAGIFLFEGGESVIEVDEAFFARGAAGVPILEGKFDDVAAAALAAALAGVIDEDVAELAGAEGEEVAAVGEVDGFGGE